MQHLIGRNRLLSYLKSFQRGLYVLLFKLVLYAGDRSTPFHLIDIYTQFRTRLHRQASYRYPCPVNDDWYIYLLLLSASSSFLYYIFFLVQPLLPCAIYELTSSYTGSLPLLEHRMAGGSFPAIFAKVTVTAWGKYSVATSSVAASFAVFTPFYLHSAMTSSARRITSIIYSTQQTSPVRKTFLPSHFCLRQKAHVIASCLLV
jgi:hypothetical protein